MLIGGKWMGYVGAIVVVIGGGLIIKLGYDAGWWGMMSEELRCGLVAGFGVLLLAAGEVALRKVGKVASAGLYGAGLGVMYLDAFATFRYFDLLSEPGAFGLMAAVALVGFATTFRTRFLTIGVLSLVGGYLTPILLAGQAGHDLELLVYLTALLGVSLGLSAIRRQAFRPLRYLALAGQVLLGFLWVIDRGATHWVMAIVFMSAWWTMILAEALWAALRRQSAIGNVISTLLATAAYVTCGCWILAAIRPATGPDWLGAFTLAIGVLSAAAAAQFGLGLDTLRGEVRTARSKLAVALWAQGGILLVTAIGLQFDDVGQVVGWLAVSVGALEIGRRLPSRGVDLFGLIVWALVMLYLPVLGVMVEARWAATTLANELWTIGAVTIDGYAALVLFAVFTTMLMAHRLRMDGERPWRVMPVVLAFAAAVGWLGIFAARSEGLTMTGAWLAGTIALLAAHRLGRRQRYVEVAMMLLSFAAAKWLFGDAIGTRAMRGWNAASMTPWLNWQMGLGLALAGCTWWTGRAARARWSPAAAVVAVTIALVALSFEIDRVIGQITPQEVASLATGPALLRALWITALWGFGGVLMLLVGCTRGQRVLASAGWLFLLGAAGAWLTLDTIGWRLQHDPVASMLVVNLQFGVGALLAIALVGSVRLLTEDTLEGFANASTPIAVSLGVIAVIGLWLGSLEIDRGFADDAMARQAGWSVYWSLYGVMLVAVGFSFKSAVARYAGLALLGITLIKVLLIDLSILKQIWRVVSFIVSGLLMLGTSVLYAKLSPRVLESLHGRGEE